MAAFFVLFAVESKALSPGEPQILPLDPQPLVIITGTGAKSYLIELADDTGERATGMMFRKAAPTGQGMLFVFGETRLVQMWMKNTLAPLDIVFIGEDSKIASISENAKPLSLDIIDSRDEVRFALELAAGTVKLDGLRVGDTVRHRAIDAISGVK